MQIYFESTSVKLAWDDELKCVYIKWDGFAYGNDLRSHMDHILRIVREKKCSKELANLQNQRITSQEDRDWIVKDWLPRAQALGLKHIAFVIPKSEYSKAGFDNMIGKADRIQNNEAFFDNEEAAREWLRQLD